VTGLASGKSPADSTNGTVRGLQAENAEDSRALEADRKLADGDETIAERDQTLSDTDQTRSDDDQTAADRDQAAADDDQAASDHDRAHGGDTNEHGASRALRERSAEQRRESAKVRFDTAAARDAVARARDLAAAARDRAAALRDRGLAARDGTQNGAPALTDMLLRTADTHRDAAAEPTAAVDGRTRAAADRAHAASDREQAARNRLQAQLEREALRSKLEHAEIDQLSETRPRAAGLAELDHEIDRARRASGPLVVAYVDVVGVKALKETNGHAAGDALLQRAVRAIRSHLRSYDLIVRLGEDEFLCIMSDTTIQTAWRRFDAVETALASDPDSGQIRVGFAALMPEDSAAELIERAGAELPPGARRR
jgi:diguanylate cyclase (GGDEF)-like protein